MIALGPKTHRLLSIGDSLLLSLLAAAAWILLQSLLGSASPERPRGVAPQWRALASPPERASGAANVELWLSGKPLAFGESAILSVRADARGSARIPVRLRLPRSKAAAPLLVSFPAESARFAWSADGAALEGLLPGAEYRLQARFWAYGVGKHSGELSIFSEPELISALGGDCSRATGGGCLLALGSPSLAAPPGAGAALSALSALAGRIHPALFLLWSPALILWRALLAELVRSAFAAAGFGGLFRLRARPGRFG